MKRSKDNIKKILPLFVTFNMLFSFVPVRVQAVTEVEKENIALSKSVTTSRFGSGTKFTGNKITDGTIDRTADINK